MMLHWNSDKPGRSDDHTGRGHGPDGVDKAPGEETSEDLENVVAKTQRGKIKDDGDPDEEADKPIDQE